MVIPPINKGTQKYDFLVTITQEILHEEVTLFRQSDYQYFETSRGRYAGDRIVSGAWHEQCSLLQMARQVWRAWMHR